MTTYAPIKLPPASDTVSWGRAWTIARAFRGMGQKNPFVVASLANGFAESWWEAVVHGDNGQSHGPWQMKWQYYGELILLQTKIDIRTEPDLGRHCTAVICALNAGPNKLVLARLNAATNGADATRIWAGDFERASAGGAVERRVALAPQIEVALSKMPA